MQLNQPGGSSPESSKKPVSSMFEKLKLMKQRKQQKAATSKTVPVSTGKENVAKQSGSTQPSSTTKTGDSTKPVEPAKLTTDEAKKMVKLSLRAYKDGGYKFENFLKTAPREKKMKSMYIQVRKFFDANGHTAEYDEFLNSLK